MPSLKHSTGAWLLAVLIIFSLAGCGQKETQPPEPSATPLPAATAVPDSPTPTRTRPARSFFVRPTLNATPTVTLEPPSSPSPVALEPTAAGENLSTPPEVAPSPTNRPQATRRPGGNGSSTPTVTPTSAATPATEIINAPPLLYFKMIDVQHGWGLTDRYILRTTDGGLQWINASPPDGLDAGSILQGFFLNINEAWVAVPESDFITGTLYHTTDGGKNWESFSVPFGSVHLFFLDSLHGWALVDRGASSGSQAIDIFATANGGETWTAVYLLTADQSPTAVAGELPYAGTKNEIAFIDLEHGWITGKAPVSDQPWLFYTEDGGESWEQQDLPIPEGYQFNVLTVSAPIFFNDSQGVLPVRLSQVTETTIFYETSDAGLTWSDTTPIAVSGPLDCVSLDSWRIWNGTTLAASDDGGANWQSQPTNVNLRTSLEQIDFTSPQVGYALSVVSANTSVLYYTANGGRSWAPLW